MRPLGTLPLRTRLFELVVCLAAFWLTESTYTQQPDVSFKHQMILMLEGSTVPLCWLCVAITPAAAV